MQLGDIETSEEDLPEPAGPKRRWTLRLLLFALVGLGVAVARHGTGVGRIEPGEAAVVRTLPGVPLLSDRVVAEPGSHGYAPLLQTFTPVDVAPREARLTGVARSRRGAPVPYADGVVVHRVQAADAPKVLRLLGPDGAARDRFVQAEAARAVRLAIGEREVSNLDEPEGVHASARERLRRALGGHGITLDRFAGPTWTVDPVLVSAAKGLKSAREKTRHHRAHAGERRQAANEERTNVDAGRARGYEALRAELAAGLESAKRAGEEARRVADEMLARRQRAAEARRDEVLTRAAAAMDVARLEAQALAARVEAVRGRGDNLLDKVIAEQVLPQLAGGAPAGEAPK